MVESKKRQQREPMDERIAIPLDPEAAMRALLQVDPDSDETTAGRAADHREQGQRSADG